MNKEELARELPEILYKAKGSHWSLPYVDGKNLENVKLDGWFDFIKVAEVLLERFK